MVIINSSRTAENCMLLMRVSLHVKLRVSLTSRNWLSLVFCFRAITSDTPSSMSCRTNMEWLAVTRCPCRLDSTSCASIFDARYARYVYKSRSPEFSPRGDSTGRSIASLLLFYSFTLRTCLPVTFTLRLPRFNRFVSLPIFHLLFVQLYINER